MNNYVYFAINSFIKAAHQNAVNGTPVSNSSSEPAGTIQLSATDDTTWTIDKTYQDLKNMYARGRLTGLSWHRSEDSIIFVPLTSTGMVDGHDSFVFSTILTTQGSSSFHSFIVPDEGEKLIYVTEDVGVETSFEVVEELVDGHPKVDNPSTKIIYLYKDSSSAVTDPYTEWIYTRDGEWEVIGETSLDLSGYYTSAQVDDKLDEKVDKVEGKGLSANDYTDADKAKLENLPDNDSLEQALSEKSDVGHTHTKSDITDFAHNHDDRYYTETEIDTALAGKVDKVTGKGLSTNDFTDEYKDKLGDLPTSSELDTALGEKADKSEMSVVAGTGSDSDKTTITLKDGTSATVLTTHQDISGKADKATTLAGYGITDAYTKTETDTELGKKVDVVEGKGLSTNDYTTGEKDKLEGIAAGAQVNVIESLSVDGVAIEPDANKNVDIHIPTLPVATAPDQLFTSTSGDPEWQQLEKSTWGTELTDTQGNVLEDENGNAVMDENAVDLWTKFNNAGFGAERAAADIEGNSIIDTYATKSEVSGAIADAHTHNNKAILDATEAPYTTAEQGKLENLPTRDELTGELDGKVDKVTGKGLSTEDYTTAEKGKLAQFVLPSQNDNPAMLFNSGDPAGIHWTTWESELFYVLDELVFASDDLLNAHAGELESTEITSDNVYTHPTDSGNPFYNSSSVLNHKQNVWGGRKKLVNAYKKKATIVAPFSMMDTFSLQLYCGYAKNYGADIKFDNICTYIGNYWSNFIMIPNGDANIEFMDNVNKNPFSPPSSSTVINNVYRIEQQTHYMGSPIWRFMSWVGVKNAMGKWDIYGYVDGVLYYICHNRSLGDTLTLDFTTDYEEYSNYKYTYLTEVMLYSTNRASSDFSTYPTNNYNPMYYEG